MQENGSFDMRIGYQETHPMAKIWENVGLHMSDIWSWKTEKCAKGRGNDAWMSSIITSQSLN